MIFGLDHVERAGRIALIDGDSGENWTYSRLCDEVNRRLELLACPRKALVFLFCRNTPSAVAWYLAALEAGHTVALAAENLDAQLRAGLLAAFTPEFVVLPETPGDHFQPLGDTGLWRAEAAEIAAEIDAEIAAEIHPGLAVLLSTSGSTGSPKLARLSRGSVEDNAAAIAKGLQLSELDRPVAHLPLHYSYGLSVLNSHLSVGATVVLSTASLISAPFWKAVADHQVTSFSGVPYTYQMLKRLRFDGMAAAKTIVSMTQAGGKLDNDTILAFHNTMSARNGAFWVMYGQTEAVARIAILPAARLQEKLGSAGCAIPGGSLLIDDAGTPSDAPGVAGELIYRGPNVMWGYAYERADLAKGDELGGTLYTGDLATLDSEGFAWIIGRAKRDAKVFGLRINMDEVEALLKPRGPVAVVNGPDKLIVYCEFGDDAELRILHAEFASKLKLHTSALDFRRIERLPTNASGKTDYNQLRAS